MRRLGIEGERCNLQRVIAQPGRKPGLRAISGTVNVEYDGNTLRDAIVADASMVLLMTLTNGTDVLQVIVPEARLNGNLPTANGAERITHDLAFEGLTSGLTVAGIPASAALSVTLVFRVLTLWLRIPVGLLALRYLQKTNAL